MLRHHGVGVAWQRVPADSASCTSEIPISYILNELQTCATSLTPPTANADPAFSKISEIRRATIISFSIRVVVSWWFIWSPRVKSQLVSINASDAGCALRTLIPYLWTVSSCSKQRQFNPALPCPHHFTQHGGLTVLTGAFLRFSRSVSLGWKVPAMGGWLSPSQTNTLCCQPPPAIHGCTLSFHPTPLLPCSLTKRADQKEKAMLRVWNVATARQGSKSAFLARSGEDHLHELYQVLISFTRAQSLYSC